LEEKTDKIPSRVKLNVIYDGKTATYDVRQGLGLQAIVLKNGLPIEFDCRKADCGICSIICQTDGFAPATETEIEFLKAMAAGANERLACQCRILHDSTIEISTDW